MTLNPELDKHFKPVPRSFKVKCTHCGKRVVNQGLAKLAHLSKGNYIHESLTLSEQGD